jgi:hypothetical protein
LTIRLALVGATAVCIAFGLYPTPLQDESNRLADSRMFRLGSEQRAVASATIAPTASLAPRGDASAPPQSTPLP